MRIRQCLPAGLGAPLRPHKSPRKLVPSISAYLPLRPSKQFRRTSSSSCKAVPAQDRDHVFREWAGEPVPGQNHPIHNASLSPEFGTNVYSTGGFPAGLERRGCAQAMLTLYCHGPLDESAHTPARDQSLRQLFQVNTQLLSYSAWSACYYLYLVAFAGLRSQEHSRDAHSRITSPVVRSPSAPGTEGDIRWSRSHWRLLCCLGQSSDERKILSRPWMSLQIDLGSKLQRCHWVSVSRAPTDINLVFAVAGHLKANPASDPHSGHSTGPAGDSVIQLVADEFAVQSKAAFAGQTDFTSPGAVMSRIRERILSYLPCSPIAAALDLKHICIRLEFGSANKHLAQNFLLNDDGTVKTDADMPISLPMLQDISATRPSSDSSSWQPTPEAPVADDDQSLHTSMGSGNSDSVTKDGTTNRFWQPSVSTQNKLGAGLTWLISKDPTKGSVDQQRLALQELDRECQKLHANGFALLVHAAKCAYQQSPSGPGFQLLCRLDSGPSTPSAAPGMTPASVDSVRSIGLIQYLERQPDQVRVDLNWGRYRFFRFALRLPGVLGTKVTIGDNVRDLHFLTYIGFEVSNDTITPSSEGPSPTINEDFVFLGRAAQLIIGRVCQATTFTSVRTCTETVAEAMLRFLKLRSLDSPLGTVGVRAIFENTSGQFNSMRSNAKWQISKNSSGPESNAERIVQVYTEDQYVMPNEKEASDQQETTGGEHLYDDDVRSESGNSHIKSYEAKTADPEIAIANLVTDNESDRVIADIDNDKGTFQGDSGQIVTQESTSAKVSDSTTNDAKLVPRRGPSYRDLRLAGLPCPHLESGNIHCAPTIQQTGLKLRSYEIFWTPRHSAAVANILPTDIGKLVEAVILDSDVSSLQSLLSTTQNVMAAIPHEPWLIRLHFWHCSTAEQSSGGAAWKAAVSVTLVSHSSNMAKIMQGGHQKFDLHLTDLRFPVATGVEDLEQDPMVKSVVRLKLRLRTTKATGAVILQQVPSLVEVIRATITPILARRTTSSMDGFEDECSAAILRSELLAAMFATTSVHLSFRVLGKGGTNGGAMASLPAAFNDTGGLFRKYIALGSNVGDRIAAIESACQSLDGSGEIRVIETSPLYETDPMYVEDQDRFLNGVCEIETNLEPIELLNRLQAIENDLGRQKTIDKGPRNIDLDILTYGRRRINSERLTVPHALMREREFVLRPLCDTLGRTWTHPSNNKTAIAHLQELPESSTPMYPLTPLGTGLRPLRSLDPKRRTRVMSILNVTPDSFSDGGKNQSNDLDTLRATILANIAAGATIIDIGGQSSRPNAEDVSAEEELSRIIPAIELIKSLPEAQGIAMSIDTYRAAVAEAAINAGAHIINDISAGLLDPDMLPTIGRLGCTYIMMHMRGTPATMQNEINTSYPDGLLPTIAFELICRLQAAQKAGIRRWRIILDPGIGFAKTVEQNIELLQRFGDLRDWPELRTYPWLVGTSRKGFIGKVTGVTDAKDRVSGTAATVTAAVQGGAEIVRVHDVKEMGEVVRMADAMYRSSFLYS